MIALIALGEVVAAVFDNPNLIIKGVILILTVLYAIFAVRVLVQIRRLENWLVVLRGYHFGIWAMVHVVLAVFGFGLALVIMWPYG